MQGVPVGVLLVLKSDVQSDVYFTQFEHKKRTRDLTQVLYLQRIAGTGFEPATSGLWERRAPIS